jgi:hypothetical protein
MPPKIEEQYVETRDKTVYYVYGWTQLYREILFKRGLDVARLSIATMHSVPKVSHNTVGFFYPKKNYSVRLTLRIKWMGWGIYSTTP